MVGGLLWRLLVFWHGGLLLEESVEYVQDDVLTRLSTVPLGQFGILAQL